MAIIKPSDLMRRKRELIERIVKDLSPGIKDTARRYLETLSIDDLRDKERAKNFLRKKGLIH
ncbi:MAG: hypothetical protein DRO40_06440 [Thermoprotei archaeon]|nr:MAG: hypothetical protein DRO40_06440 [Thermoprotei archaeon]